MTMPITSNVSWPWRKDEAYPQPWYGYNDDTKAWEEASTTTTTTTTDAQPCDSGTSHGHVIMSFRLIT